MYNLVVPRPSFLLNNYCTGTSSCYGQDPTQRPTATFDEVKVFNTIENVEDVYYSTCGTLTPYFHPPMFLLATSNLTFLYFSSGLPSALTNLGVVVFPGGFNATWNSASQSGTITYDSEISTDVGKTFGYQNTSANPRYL